MTQSVLAINATAPDGVSWGCSVRVGALLPCPVVALGNVDLTRFHAGYADGEDAGLDLRFEPPPAFYDWPRWRRFGWRMGNEAARERRSADAVGGWLRELGLPVGVNPWLRDTASGLAFEEGWGLVDRRAVLRARRG